MDEIKAVLLVHGDMFSGGIDRVDDVAQDWMGYGFDVTQVDVWAEVGVWNPAVASKLIEAGFNPQQLSKALKGAKGDPVYDACNDDMAIVDLVDMVKAYWA